MISEVSDDYWDQREAEIETKVSWKLISEDNEVLLINTVS